MTNKNLYCRSLLRVACLWATPLLCLPAHSQPPANTAGDQLTITIHDEQINALRAHLLNLEATRKLNTANSIRRAYDTTVTGWLDLGETFADAQLLENVKQEAETKDALLLPCLMVLSIDPNKNVAYSAREQAYQLSDSIRPRSAQVNLQLAVVRALQILATDANSDYRIAAMLCLRDDYPYAECPSLSLDDWLKLCDHPAGEVRALAVRQLKNFPEQADQLVAMLMNRDDPYAKWDICQTVTELAPNRDTIDWLRARILLGRSEPVKALIGLAYINPDARQALGSLLAAAPSDFTLNSNLNAEQRDRLVVSIKSHLVGSLEVPQWLRRELAKDLGELLLWRAGEPVSLEHTQLRIDTVVAITEAGEEAIPYLHRAANAGVEEALIGLVRLDAKNRSKHANAIMHCIRSTDEKIIFDVDKVIAFYKALEEQGQLAESTRSFLLQRFTHHDEVTLVEAIVKTLQQSDLESAEAITRKLMERIEELDGVTGDGRLMAHQLIKMIGEGGSGALSAARLLKEAVESANPIISEAGAHSMIRLADLCPEYRSSIANALQPAFKNEWVANQVALDLTGIGTPMPGLYDAMSRAFRKTNTERLKLNLAEAIIAMGEAGIASELLAEAIEGGHFINGNLAEAREILTDIEFTNRASASDRVDRARQHLVANMRTASALEALSSLSASASSALPLLEASLADLSDPYRVAVNAIAILKIAPEHQLAKDAIQRLLRVPHLSTQSELRLADYHAANSSAE